MSSYKNIFIMFFIVSSNTMDNNPLKKFKNLLFNKSNSLFNKFNDFKLSWSKGNTTRVEFPLYLSNETEGIKPEKAFNDPRVKEAINLCLDKTEKNPYLEFFSQMRFGDQVVPTTVFITCIDKKENQGKITVHKTDLNNPFVYSKNDSKVGDFE